MHNMRITVLVTEEEHAKIKQAAGLIPLSAYLKAAVLAQLPADGRGGPAPAARKAKK
jgi:hypothetical protein